MKKAFDSVAFQDREAERIYGETQGMDCAEELAYWRAKSKQLRPKGKRGPTKPVASAPRGPRSCCSR
jgi:hypothetical protein